MAITALANRNREAIPPTEISQQLGVENSDLDKNLLRVNAKVVESETCSSKDKRAKRFTIQILQKIDSNISSIDDLFAKIHEHGAGAYYPILRKLIAKEKKEKSDIYRILYEVFASVDTQGADTEEPLFRKSNLQYLLSLPDLQDQWRFYCEYIELCYENEDYDAIIDCSPKALASLDEADADCSNGRFFVYLLLGTIYLARKQYQYAIPYFKAVADHSDYPVSALFRLTYLYAEELQDYQQGLYYAQLCFIKTPDSCLGDEWNHMEYHLVKWIAYCAAACGDYEKGCETLENYLNTASGNRSDDEQIRLKSYLAYCLVRCNRYDEAARIAKEVLDADPRNPTATNVKGMCEMKNGHYPIAARCFSSIIEEFKQEKTKQSQYYLGEIYNNLAICETRLNHKPDAEEYFRHAFECGYPNVDVTEFSKVADVPLGVLEQASKNPSSRETT